LKKCAKCKDTSDGAIIVEGGKNYHFCNYCYEKIMSAPKNNTHLMDFLSMSKTEWIDRNIKLAKELREKGESPWQS
jgi:hypothetical protein